MKRAVPVVLALMIVACRDQPKRPRARPAPIVASDAAAAAVEARPWVGVIAPLQSVELAPSFDSVLADVRVRPGDSVSEGMVVATLDPRPLREQLGVAQASHSATLAALRRADVDLADADAKQKIEERAVADGLSPQNKLDDARFAVARAQAARASAIADVNRAAGEVSLAKDRLDHADLRAAFAGTVAVRHADPGAIVGPGQPVVRIVGNTGLTLRFAVPPEVAASLPPGAALAVTIAGRDGEVATTLRRIAPSLDAASQMVIAEADLPPAIAGDLRPGQAATVRPAAPP